MKIQFKNPTRNRKKPRTHPVQNPSQKMKEDVATLFEQERIIWDLQYELHSNGQALQAACDRVAEEA